MSYFVLPRLLFNLLDLESERCLFPLSITHMFVVSVRRSSSSSVYLGKSALFYCENNDEDLLLLCAT